MTLPSLIATSVICATLRYSLARLSRNRQLDEQRNIRILDRIDGDFARLGLADSTDSALTPNSMEALRSKGVMAAIKCLRQELNLPLKVAVDRVRYAMGPGVEKKLELVLSKLAS